MPDSVGSWIYVTDAAKAAIDVLDAPKEKIQTMNYNVASIPAVISARETEALLTKRYPEFKVEYKMSADPRRMTGGMAVTPAESGVGARSTPRQGPLSSGLRET